MRPIYETSAEKAHERAVVAWLKPKFIKVFTPEWGKLRFDMQTKQLDHADHELHFEKGVLFIEVKNRTAKFQTYMISESKITEIQEKVTEKRQRGFQSKGFIVVTVPKGDIREAVAFNVEASYCNRKMGGRDDRNDGIDREPCLYYNWDVGIILGNYAYDERRGILRPHKL